MSSRRFRDSDPTANAAVRAADRSASIPTDVALTRAAQARLKRDYAGYDRFMSAARRAVTA